MKTYTILVRVTKEMQVVIDAESASAACDLAVYDCSRNGEICDREVYLDEATKEELLAEKTYSSWQSAGVQEAH